MSVRECVRACVRACVRDLEEAGAAVHLVDAVVIVAREDEREVELLARPVVLRHVEVAQRDDEVDPVLRLQLRLVGAHGRVRALDARAAKGVAPVHGGVVGEDADEAHPAATRRRSQLDNVAGDHVPRLEGVVRLHICVYPDSIVLGCALDDELMLYVVFVVSENHHVDRGLVQHTYHTLSLIQTRQ